jgi:AmmeMemoRadiSam system protein A
MQSLSEAERKAALHLARSAVIAAVFDRSNSIQIPQESIFARRRGVFVTLHVGGKLQGCIGLVEPAEPLGEAIAHCAACAALEDPRFHPLQQAQLPQLQIEISILSRLEPISPASVEIGRHGLLISSHGRRGLLLPQVATEHHFTREQFLEETCWKAGLPKDAWRDPEAKLLGFTCDVFSEPQSPS